MKSFLFQNARVLDGTGAFPFDGDVLVEGNRIGAIFPGGKRESIENAESIDCAGATLMPGLVEPHAHLSFLDQATPHHFSSIPVEEHLLATLRHARIYLDAGFTACFGAAATKPRLDIVARNAIDAGEFPGPRLLAASVQLTVTGGVGDLRQMHFDPGEAMYTLPCDGPVEFTRAAREACREGVDVLKIVPSGDTSTPSLPSARTLMTREEIAAVTQVARQQEKRVAAHARSAESVKLSVQEGVDVLYHATYADEEGKDLIEAHRGRVFVAPAMSVTWTRLHESGKHGLPSSPESRERIGRDLERTIECMKDLKRRGVRVLPGGDYGFLWNPHGANARDLEFFVDLMGFTPMEAIVAATKWGGEIMGRSQELGLVKKGYLADLLLVDGDPLADVRMLQDRARLAAIMKDGLFHKAPYEWISASREEKRSSAHPVRGSARVAPLPSRVKG